VAVNGRPVTEPGTRADPEVDDIRVDGRPLAPSAKHLYVLLNKPTGVVTTVRDPHAPRTVMSLVKGVPARVYPVGRLDADSAGLLLLTNDGDFAQLLTHPSHEMPKTYRVVVRGRIGEQDLDRLRRGVELEDGRTAPGEARWVQYDRTNNASVIDLTIHEGRNRQVRRMLRALGFPVLALTRTQIGPLQLKGLAPGVWRCLRPAEVEALRSLAASPKPPRAPAPPPPAPAPKPPPPRPPARPVPRREPAALDRAKEEARELDRRLREVGRRGREGAPRQGQAPPRRPRGKGRAGA